MASAAGYTKADHGILSVIFSQGEYIQAAGTNVPILFFHPRQLSPPPAIPECASAVAEADSVKEAWSRATSAAPEAYSVKEARSRAAFAAPEADSVKEGQSRAASAAPEAYSKGCTPQFPETSAIMKTRVGCIHTLVLSWAFYMKNFLEHTLYFSEIENAYEPPPVRISGFSSYFPF